MAWCPISLERDQFDGYGVICTVQYDSFNSLGPSEAYMRQ